MAKTTVARLSCLVGPAHFGAYSHQRQLRAIAVALAARGHKVTYVTTTSEAADLSDGEREPDAHENLTVIVAESREWTANLDLDLGMRVARGEAEWQVRVDLVTAACDASERFFRDAQICDLLQTARFDVAVVDGGALCNHVLADALHPVPQVHYLCYPPHYPFQSKKAEVLYASAIQKRVGTRLQSLRASVRAPPKPQCQPCHVLTVVGHSRVFVPPDQQVTLPLGAECCVGSVLDSQPVPPLPSQLATWADASEAAGGFVVVCMGSWADVACSKLGKDAVILEALRQLDVPAIWKTAAGARGEIDDGGQPAPNVSFASWIPQRALLAHRLCKLLVCHGGANSISEACACAVPVVGLPVAWDQPHNAAMLEQLQVGRCVPLPSCSASALRDAMRALLGDAEAQTRASALATAMREGDMGVDGAAVLVERAVQMATVMKESDAQAEDAQAVPEVESGRSQAGSAQKEEEDTGWGDELD